MQRVRKEKGANANASANQKKLVQKTTQIFITFTRIFN